MLTSYSSAAICLDGYLSKKSEFQALGRSWKVYRCVLRGSKLHFYKPFSEHLVKLSMLSSDETEPPTIEIQRNLSNAPYALFVDKGIPLNPETFDLCAKSLLFDLSPAALPIGHIISSIPLARRYIYGDIVTHMMNSLGSHQIRQYYLLMFDDSVIIFPVLSPLTSFSVLLNRSAAPRGAAGRRNARRPPGIWRTRDDLGRSVIVVVLGSGIGPWRGCRN